MGTRGVMQGGAMAANAGRPQMPQTGAPPGAEYGGGIQPTQGVQPERFGRGGMGMQTQPIPGGFQQVPWNQQPQQQQYQQQPQMGGLLGRLFGGNMFARQPFGLSPYMGYGMLSPQFAVPQQQFQPPYFNPIQMPNASAPTQAGNPAITYNQWGAPVFAPINLTRPMAQQTPQQQVTQPALKDWNERPSDNPYAWSE